MRRRCRWFVGFELSGALFELAEERTEGFAASDVGNTAQVAAEPLAEHADLLGEAARPFLGVGQLRAQALLGDERAGSRQARSAPAWR